MTQTYTIVVEKSDEGFYAEAPGVLGVYAQGDAEEEVLENIKDVLELTLKDMKERGENIIDRKAFPKISFSAISVNV